MKRFTAIILTLIMLFSLCACEVKPGNQTEPTFTDSQEVTFPDNLANSDVSFVDLPQTGEYKETALLTNVPGQRVPLLLDMRQDGTIDYIFAGVEEKSDFQSFEACGAAYYTIAPDGTAIKQDDKWMAEIDSYLTQTLKSTQDPNGKWRFLFASEEGTILILGQYHNVAQSLNEKGTVKTSGKFLYCTLFKVVDGQVTIVPLQWNVEFGSEVLDLRTQYISRIESDGEHITVYKRDVLKGEPYENLCTVIYNMDGTVESAQKLTTEYPFLPDYRDDTGIFVESMDYQQRRSDNSGDGFAEFPQPELRYDSPYVGEYCKSLAELYGDSFSLSGDEWYIYLDFNPYNPYGDSEPVSYQLHYHDRYLDNIKAVAQGSGVDYCCWYDEAGTGLLMRYTYNPEGKIDPEILTVWSTGAYSTIQAAIAQWNATHSSPIFKLQWSAYDMQQETLTEDDYLTRLTLQLLNNQGPDVMVLDGLNMDRYLEFMTPLDIPTIDGVYESLLSRFSIGDDVLAVPLRLSPYLMGRIAEDTEEITSLEQFADLVEANNEPIGTDEDGRPETLPARHLYTIDDYTRVFQLWYPAWQDAIWEGGKLNKEVFMEFLTHTTRLSDAYALEEYDVENGKRFDLGDMRHRSAFTTYLQDTDGHMMVEHYPTRAYTMAATKHVGLYSYWRYANEDEANEKPDPHYLSGIPGPDGTGVMIPKVVVGVRAGGNEVAGKEFVELLLSRELQLGSAWHDPAKADGYPSVWKFTEELLERTEDHMNQEYAVENDYQELMNSLRAVVIDEFLFEAAMTAAQSCYRTEDRLTPEEAAEALAEATRIYLAELR